MKVIPLDNLIKFRDECWKEHKNYKEAKDKILYFIGTLFTAAFIGAGYILLQLSSETTSKVYLLQYTILHIFFLVLFLVLFSLKQKHNLRKKICRAKKTG